MKSFKLNWALLAVMWPGLALTQLDGTNIPNPVHTDPSLELQPYASMDEIAITSHVAGWR
jgi:hypothetical protein